MAIFDAQPFGPGLFLRDAALFVAHLDDQISLLMPCLAQKPAPARPRTKWQQTLSFRRGERKAVSLWRPGSRANRHGISSRT
ncbi:hypothetical protein EA795_06475 [Stutzerimonas nitrititolerans]|uniref:Uncharacterized protein n=1 Tax=Stutzerimonas nitrititolerans TaxID=2482751 RepID=A0ABX9V768_9GAMM|nr:hypothetical protein EA795_06475 [Stutzerimonas nitrititolerans]